MCGLKSEAIQRKLLSEAELDYEKAMQIALAMETADRQTRELKTGQPSGANLRVNTGAGMQ